MKLTGKTSPDETFVGEVLRIDKEECEITVWLGLPTDNPLNWSRHVLGPEDIMLAGTTEGPIRLKLAEDDPSYVCLPGPARPRVRERIVSKTGKCFEVIADHTGADDSIHLRPIDSPADEEATLDDLVGEDDDLVFRHDDDQYGPHWRISSADDVEPIDRYSPRESRLLKPLTWAFISTNDWRKAGEAYRTTLERGHRLPEPVWSKFQEAEVGEERLSSVWSELRRDHLNVCWPHLVAERTLGELAAVNNREWDAEQLHRRLVAHLGEVRDKSIDQGLDDYVERIESVAPSDFWAETFELWQLVEWTERRKQGFFPIRKFLDRILPYVDLDLAEMTRPHPWWALFEALPKRSERYRRYPIEKSSGDARWIEEPCAPLKRIQRRIADILNGYRAAHPCATGFVDGRSTSMHARHHAGAKVAVVVDIRKFFPSISREQVLGGLSADHDLGGATDGWANPFTNWRSEILEFIANLVCHPYTDNLPQGSPSSPAIANLVAHELDERICKLVRKRMAHPRLWNYSRYADDLVLSRRGECSEDALDEAYTILNEAIREMNWRPAPEKTRRWQAWKDGPLTVCGIEVPTKRDGDLRLPRSVRRRVRAARHHLVNNEGTDKDRGLLAYAYSVTGDHRFRVDSSKDAETNVVRLTLGLVSLSDDTIDGAADAFFEGWLGRE